MKKINLIKILTILFFLVGFLDILGLILDEKLIRTVFKPLIVPALALIYIVSVHKKNKTYLAALFFSFLGDVLLLNKSSNFFLLGLSSFLIAHIAYISILTKTISTFKIKQLILAAIPFTLTLVALLLVIKGSLGSLFMPVLVYGIVISVLGSLSFYNYLEKRELSSLLLLLGVFLFIASDGVLAVQRFMVSHRELELGITVMGTYILAQYLICRFMIEKEKTS